MTAPRFSLAAEIGVMFVALGLLPLFLIGWRYFDTAETQLREEIRRNLAVVADTKAARVEAFARDRMREASALAGSPLAVETLAALALGPGEDAALERWREALEARDLYLISPQGIVLHGAGPGRDMLGRRLGGGALEAQLAGAFDRARTLLEPQVSDFAPRPDGGVGAFVAAPVLRGGQVLGVVALRIDEEEVFRIVGDHTGLGRTGETQVAGPAPGGAVRLYGVPRFPEALAAPVLAADAPAAAPFLQALAGERGVGVTTDYRGEAVVAAWRYLPSFRWGLMVKADVAERLSPIANLTRLGLLVSAIAVLLVVVVSIFMARAITVPIRALEAATHDVAEAPGRDLRRLEETGAGAWEIASLAHAFDRMARRIHAYQTGLRRMVDERTAELRAAKDQAESATRAKTEFLAMMSHELRTPLNGIVGMAELLRGHPMDPQAEDYVRTIQASGRALGELLEDVLDISRIEAGKLTFERRDFDPAGVVDGLAVLMRQAAARKGLAFHVALDPRVPRHLHGDPARLRQVLLNLVGNAVKFTEAGSVRLAVAVSHGDDSHVTLRFTVADTGVGLPLEGRDRLFQPFSQLGEAAAAQGGAGLGLAISRRLIEGMGGTIGVDSAPGEGATFIVDLPFTTAEERPDDGAEAGPLPPLRLLVVEDEPVNRQILDGLLRRDGHAVQAVASAHDALALLDGGAMVDLALTDLRLPGLSGLDFARRLAEAGGPPVMAVTANLMPEDRAACTEAGIRAVVGKPILMGELRAALRRALDGVPPPPPEPAAPATEVPAFDPAYLDDLAAALPAEEVDRLIGLAEASLRDGLDRLRGAEGAEVAEAAHRLAGVAGGYGLLKLREACKAVEAGQGEAAAEIAALVEEGVNALNAYHRAGQAEA